MIPRPTLVPAHGCSSNPGDKEQDTETILGTVGSTPCVRLVHLPHKGSAELWLKLERSNPAGSVKDRSALHLVECAEREGLLRPGGTIIESSSGNFGISLAMIGAAKGYRVIVLVDPKTTQANLAVLRAYGAKVIVVDEQDDMGAYHKTRISKANALHREIPNSFRPDQCFNVQNAEAHYQTTAREIWEQCHRTLDAIVVPVSTGGQLGGISRYFREHAPQVQIVGVDVEGSTIFGGRSHGYLVQGMGLGWTPVNLDDLNRIDLVYKVRDDDAFVACRSLARHEGILAGASSGASLIVALHVASRLAEGKKVLAIAADGGERYLRTVFDEEWLEEQGMSPCWEREELWRRVQELKLYSDNPTETANYQERLAGELGACPEFGCCRQGTGS